MRKPTTGSSQGPGVRPAVGGRKGSRSAPQPNGIDPLRAAIHARLGQLASAPKHWTAPTPGSTPRPSGRGAVTQGGQEASATHMTGKASHQELPFSKGVSPAATPDMVRRGKGLANHKAPGAPAMAAGSRSRKVRPTDTPSRRSRPAY
jgi:hypothetical protein